MATRESPRSQRTGRPAGAATDSGSSPEAPAPATSSITSLTPNQEATSPGYVTPVFHIHLPERVVNVGFWAALAGSAALGVVDLPLAALIGGAVYVARHHARSGA